MRTIRAALAISFFGLALCVQSGLAEDKLKPRVLLQGIGGGASFAITDVSPTRGASFRVYYARGYPDKNYGTWVTDGTQDKVFQEVAYPEVMSPDGRYLVTKTYNQMITLNDLFLKTQAKMPLKYPGNPGLEKYYPLAVEVVDGRVTVVGTLTFGSEKGDVVFVWTVGKEVRLLDTFEDGYGKYSFGGDASFLFPSLSKDGTLFVCGLGLKDSSNQSMYRALIGNIGRLSQPLRISGPCYLRSSPSGALIGRDIGDGTKDSIGAKFGVGKWGPVVSSNASNYRKYEDVYKQTIFTGKFLPDTYQGKPINSVNYLRFGTLVTALTENGFAVLNVFSMPQAGRFFSSDMLNEVVIVAPGEGEFKINDYLAKKGIQERVEPERVVMNAVLGGSVSVVEKEGFRFMLIDGKLFNLGAIPGYVAPPKIKPTVTPGASVMEQ